MQLYLYTGLCILKWTVFLYFLLRRSEPDVPAGSEGGVLFPQTGADLGSISGGQ